MSPNHQIARIAAIHVLLLIAALAGATRAGAIVANVHAHGYGVTAIRGVDPHSLPGAHARSSPPALASPPASSYDELPGGGSPLQWLGGPVMHTNTAHVIYWDPAGEFTATTKEIINRFFTGVANDSGLASNVFGTNGQYTDGSGNAAYRSTFGGELVDGNAYPASGCTIPKVNADPGPPYTRCLTDNQLQTELSSFITAQKLPKGPTQLYFVLFPHKVVTCYEAGACSNNVFCAYHSWINPGANEIIYADIPFSLLDSEFAKGCQSDGNAKIQAPNGDAAGTNASTRFADVAIKYISHEWSEAITDPLVGGKLEGKEATAWVDEEGLENGDKCNAVPLSKAEEGEPGLDRHAFTPTLGGTAFEQNLFNQSINGQHFYIQSEWDNTAKACLMRPLALASAGFSAGSAVAGSPVTFTGSASDPYGTPGVSWTFGDGATATGPSTAHTYAAPGAYTVTMTATDPLTGSSAAVAQTVVVSSPPQPPPSAASTAAVAGVGQPPGVPLTSAPNSSFGKLRAIFDPRAGTITFTGKLADHGIFSWLLTFQNGRFGVFGTVASKCRKGFVRIERRCRPARILFAKGKKLAQAGTVSFTVRPTAPARRALRNAFRRGKGFPVTAVFKFQSSLGGSPFSRSQPLMFKLARK